MDSGTTLAARFATALSEEDTRDAAELELLPGRLARAVTRLLPVDGVGLSVLSGGVQRRAPLGASDEVAGRAERLQFTVGSGPCLLAQDSRQPVFVVEDDLRRRWPAFHDLLVSQTPYRAIVALPLRNALTGMGAMDLYFRDSADVAALDVFAAVTAGDLVTQRLSEAAVWSNWSAADGPAVMHGPTAVRRAVVWQAIGRTSLALDVTQPEALAVLRAHAYATGATLDDLAAAVVDGRADPAGLADGRSD
ncbi:MAG: uncharacterized protein JWP46_3557 [Modestobacter sp.]|nr:uncharacterized protein [Modestobacter sp.]